MTCEQKAGGGVEKHPKFADKQYRICGICGKIYLGLFRDSMENEQFGISLKRWQQIYFALNNAKIVLRFIIFAQLSYGSSILSASALDRELTLRLAPNPFD